MQKDANADWVHVRMKMMDFKAPHAAPLIAYADEVAEALELGPGGIPYPDPVHGGTGAEVLFLFSHPGDQAIRDRGGSGLLSLENKDVASRNCLDECVRIGLDVDRVTLWNAVPQPLPKGKNPGVEDLRGGARWLPGLLDLLPKVQVVALLSRNAETTWDAALPNPSLDHFDPVRGPGPGQQGTATRGARQRLTDVFDEIAKRLDTTPPT
ncbi:hypothetical protein EV188_10138 [Actinomycetospora succinea]|uniref:Uracil DNA glycosylase superfamily protein n=1 Tax=Actinomycetospora succinea TaxID=663603 RepID=A0A4R6VNB8_9PSEU|nr:hypothetical protein [Actinomycetospora succinea]TDQ64791.1 hypothetical protein EV188_10138 [Actinomycetospora succinea]